MTCETWLLVVAQTLRVVVKETISKRGQHGPTRFQVYFLRRACPPPLPAQHGTRPPLCATRCCMPALDSPAVYHLRLRLGRITPLIRLRLLVTTDTTIAELHAIIQIAFGWSDSHLHQFVIHGKSYGIAYLGGVSFADSPDQVRLADFRFRTSERFFYEYNFHVPWRHEIR